MTNSERTIINELINSVNGNTANIGALINGMKETGNQTVANAEDILSNSQSINTLTNDFAHMTEKILHPMAQKIQYLETTLEETLGLLADVAKKVAQMQTETPYPKEKAEA